MVVCNENSDFVACGSSLFQGYRDGISKALIILDSRVRDTENNL